ILLPAALNWVLGLPLPRSQLLLSRHAFLLLAYDILQLAALLYLTGGLENPFAFLLVVPVAVSASTQPLAVTASLTVLNVALATFLARYPLPLPLARVDPPLLPLTYLIVLWSGRR